MLSVSPALFRRLRRDVTPCAGRTGGRLNMLGRDKHLCMEDSRMAAKPEKGHVFDFDTEVCAKCGMTKEHYEYNGKPPCKK
jgi:hypothetical protein